jgi:DNA mismatch endonuclease Vsr
MARAKVPQGELSGHTRDVFTKRSQVMSLIRAKDTKPEIAVRRGLHALGYRFRLHDPALPGHPDIVLRKHRTIIEVRGCFWHSHKCLRGRIPWKSFLLGAETGSEQSARPAQCSGSPQNGLASIRNLGVRRQALDEG